MEQTHVFPVEDTLTTAQELERLMRWLVAQGYSYEDAYRCIAFMAWGADREKGCSGAVAEKTRQTVKHKGG